MEKEGEFTLLKNNNGINFENTLSFSERLNPYTYRNFYNGGGVAIGDINNDGLDDIYLTGNMVENKLYLNKDNFIDLKIHRMGLFNFVYLAVFTK